MLSANKLGINQLDNLMSARKVVRECEHLDGGYCEENKAWCYIIQSCATKGVSPAEARAAKVRFNRNMIEQFGTVWVQVSPHGTFNTYVYEGKSDRNTFIGTFKNLVDALKVQAKFCEDNKVVNKNRNIDIKEVAKHERSFNV